MSTTVILEPETEETPAPKKRLRVLLVLLLVVALAAGAGWFLFLEEAPEPVDVDGEIVQIPAMTTTVGESSLHHARVALAVVLADGEAPADIEPRIPLLQDALLRELARMDAAQVRSAEGSDELRQALTEDAKEIWGDEVIRRVVLTELLIN